MKRSSAVAMAMMAAASMSHSSDTVFNPHPTRRRSSLDIDGEKVDKSERDSRCSYYKVDSEEVKRMSKRG